MSETDLSIALASFARLSRPDQGAVERRLSPAERERLRVLIATRQREARAAARAHKTARMVKLAPYSAWLSHRLARIVDDKADITPRAREAVRALLIEEAAR